MLTLRICFAPSIILLPQVLAHFLHLIPRLCLLMTSVITSAIKWALYIRKNIDELDTVTSSDEIDEYHQDCATCMSDFRPITQDELLTIIKKTPTKSCQLDPIPTWLLKEHITSFLPTLTDIVNASLTSGVFPDVLRDATLENYRDSCE